MDRSSLVYAFADDLILFGETSLHQVGIIKKCLDIFCESLDQRVSNEKTRIFFSKNVHNNRRQEICYMLGFSRTYLGVPLHHKRVTKRTYQFILDKAARRLSGWKVHSLSLTGRVTLSHSVLTSLPIYIMQIVNVPTQVCNELDKKCRGFIWGSSSCARKNHLVKWSRSVNRKTWVGWV